MTEPAESVRDELAQLLRSRAVLHGEFVLSSGAISSVYLDARRVTLSSIGSFLAGRLIYDRLLPDLPDVVAGMSLGADPLITAVTVTSAARGRGVDGLLVRKSEKAHGTGRRIEGPVTSGSWAVVLEDTSTTGRSALEVVSALREVDVKVAKVVVLVDREEGARTAVAQAGLCFEAIFGLSELLRADGSAATSSRPAGLASVVLRADGAAIRNPGPAGAGFVVQTQAGQEIARGQKSLGQATNNVAEYQALLLGLEKAQELGARVVTVRMDSELVIYQMTGRYRVKNERLGPLFVEAKRAAAGFDRVRFEHVPREQNRLADSLASAAARESVNKS